MKARHLLLPVILVFVLASCSAQKKLRALQGGLVDPVVIPSDIDTPQELVYDPLKRDTLIVPDDEGNDMVIMRAIRDDNGEMVANDVIDAAKVTARFRNVAERHGKVDIKFQIIVPKAMQDAKWQLRFRPIMKVFGETVWLDSIIISGSDYRKAQLRGYNLYEKYLESIITDSSAFLNNRELEIFLKRNAELANVTDSQAVEHYTREWKVRANDRRVARKDKMYAKYVKMPIITEGLRLDTVVTSYDGDFLYEYTQTINTRPMLKNVSVSLDGDVYQENRKLYSIPESDPLTYYISSLSSFVDERVKYITRIIERKVQANSICWIDFTQGSAVVDTSLSSNAEEIGRIRTNFMNLLEDEEFDMDSIIVTASCSPEGTLAFNNILSQRRSEAVSKYFKRIDDQTNTIKFISRSVPENWTMLMPLVNVDPELSEDSRQDIASIMKEPDLDIREQLLSAQPYYRHLREKVYPRLRTVRFDFCLHRKGMLKDTVHTTVVDTAYMRGVQAIKDRDYKTAVSILRPYADFNAAVAYCALDYNVSAMTILQSLGKTDKNEYMLAILFARAGNDQEAVQHYLIACQMNPSYVHRGNLDPEISALIKKYGLNKD